jgi:dTDP-4-amino-4,6-dideoxygalactose transaminase
MIRHSLPTLGPEDSAAVRSVLEHGFVGAGGRSQALAEAVRQHATADAAHTTLSGTDALMLGLRTLGLRDGAVIGVPVLTCDEVVAAARRAGYRVSLCEVKASDLTLDVAALPDALDAVIAPHGWGAPVDVDALDATGLPWIEDCATSPFTRTSRGWAGAAGWASIYSFGSTKYLTGGGGGAVALRGASAQRWSEAVRWAGSPHALGDLNASLALAQWERGVAFRERRQFIAETYDQALRAIGLTPQNRQPGHSVFRYLVRTPGPAHEVCARLQADGIDARTSINPWLYDEADVAIVARPERGAAWDHWNGHLLSVPIYPGLDDGAIATVCEALARAFGA